MTKTKTGTITQTTTSESENLTFTLFCIDILCFTGQPSWQGSPLKCNCAKRRSLAQLSPYRSFLKKRYLPQWIHLVTNSNLRGGGYSTFLNETILGSLVTHKNLGGSGYRQWLQDRVSQLLLQRRRGSVLEGEQKQVLLLDNTSLGLLLKKAKCIATERHLKILKTNWLTRAHGYMSPCSIRMRWTNTTKYLYHVLSKGGEGFANRDGWDQRGNDFCHRSGVWRGQGVRLRKRGIQVMLVLMSWWDFF